MLGAGIALLLADRLTDAGRHGIGRWLLAVGALSTIPLAWKVFRNGRHEEPKRALAQSDSQEVPIRRGRHQMLPIAVAGTVEAQRR